MSAPLPPGDLAARLGVTFRNRELIGSALRHPTARNEERQKASAATVVDDNARLEFLGDAVIGLCISEWLYACHPDAREGSLTDARKRYVQAEAIEKVAVSIGIDRYLVMGVGETKNSEVKAVLKRSGDALEALVGAVYLDSGYASATALVRMLWARAFPELVASEALTSTTA